MTTDHETHGAAPADAAALRRAETAIERLRWAYICEWAPDALDEMEAAVLALRGYAGAGATGAAARRGALLRLSHDMTGQAATFGLDLLADFAASLHALAAAAPRIGAREADVALAHVMAMRTALASAAGDPEGIPSARLERELRLRLRTILRRTLN